MDYDTIAVSKLLAETQTNFPAGVIVRVYNTSHRCCPIEMQILQMTTFAALLEERISLEGFVGKRLRTLLLEQCNAHLTK